jgi:hypothetical protein
MTDYTGAQWRKSTYSMGTGNCVEFSRLSSGEVALRDTKDQAGPAISFSPSAWGAFVGELKAAEFDLRP